MISGGSPCQATPKSLLPLSKRRVILLVRLKEPVRKVPAGILSSEKKQLWVEPKPTGGLERWTQCLGCYVPVRRFLLIFPVTLSADEWNGCWWLLVPANMQSTKKTIPTLFTYKNNLSNVWFSIMYSFTLGLMLGSYQLQRNTSLAE